MLEFLFEGIDYLLNILHLKRLLLLLRNFAVRLLNGNLALLNNCFGHLRILIVVGLLIDHYRTLQVIYLLFDRVLRYDQCLLKAIIAYHLLVLTIHVINIILGVSRRANFAIIHCLLLFQFCYAIIIAFWRLFMFLQILYLCLYVVVFFS